MHSLQKYVQEELGWQASQVKKAYLDLQNSYRAGQRIGYADIAQIQAYVFTRFPATYSVCLKIFEKYSASLQITSILDWGCGISTASLALSHFFKNIEYFLIEQDIQAKTYATQFLKHFHPDNPVQTSTPKNVDLSVFSYSLGEVDTWQLVLDEIWPKTRYLLIIEPGTPAHFKRLLQMRDYMLAKEAHILGPCCHPKICPLKGGDWCHFSANVARSKEHRLLKKAERSFENEAYSYMLFAKEPKIPAFGRLVAQPRLHGGHIDLKICSKSGEIITPTIGRSASNYKQLKKNQWGDTVNIAPDPD
jgi:ribosomal protein RSM22 (predicted rRNA methylase)